jgi:hypothetical protein
MKVLLGVILLLLVGCGVPTESVPVVDEEVATAASTLVTPVAAEPTATAMMVQPNLEPTPTVTPTPPSTATPTLAPTVTPTIAHPS